MAVQTDLQNRTERTLGSSSWIGRLRALDLSSPRHADKLGYILLAPAVLLIFVILVYPILLSVDLSLQDVDIPRIGETREPYTLDNYTKLFGSAEFWRASWVSLKLIVVVTSACFAIGLATALLVNQHFKGRTLARLFVALPWAVPEVIAVVTWWWMFDSSFGLINWLLVTLDLADKPIAWLSQPVPAFLVVSIVMIWKGYPFVSIMLLAGLQAIPEDHYQAAKVDGAGAWQRLFWITLPSLLPVFGVTMILVVLWVFRDFAVVFILTGGGPIGATQTLSMMTYEQAFGFFRMGFASAIGVVTLVICVLATRLMVSRMAKSMY